MTYAEMSKHMHKLSAPDSGWQMLGAWEWPYPHGQCGCGQKNDQGGPAPYSHPDHVDHENVHHDAVHAEVRRPDGRLDFLRLSGEYVRQHTAEEVGGLISDVCKGVMKSANAKPTAKVGQ